MLTSNVSNERKQRSRKSDDLRAVRPTGYNPEAVLMGLNLVERKRRAQLSQPSSADVVKLLARGRDSNPGNPVRTAYEVLTEFDKYVLHQDDDMLILNKPPHLNSESTEDSEFKFGLQEIARLVTHTPVLCANRLDRDTSGVIVFGKNHEAIENLYVQFADKDTSKMQKIYLAILDGEFSGSSERRIDAAIDIRNKMRVRTVPKGVQSRFVKDSTTLFTPLTLYQTHDEPPKRRTLTMVQILTGRTHQIRVVAEEKLHMPVTGDKVYNNNQTGVPRQMLHSFGLGIMHPVTGERIVVEAPIPQDFNDVLASMTRLNKY